jgi:predicted anti-sigma-YlaC factor YlaD
MLFGRCPSQESLETFAASGPSIRIAEHIAGCPACRKAVETISRDQKLLFELKSATQESADEAVRSRIVAICLEATQRAERAHRQRKQRTKPN